MDHLGVLGQEGERLARAAGGGDLAAPVPSCPGWSVRDLVVHVGEVHRRWAARVAVVGTEEPPVDESAVAAPAGAGEEALLAWYRAGLADLLATLDATDPARPAWNWTGRDLHAGWVRRRMAHETAVHRWDAERAAGDPGPVVPPAFAADGVDEVLRVWLPAHEEGTWPGPPATVHLHATDAHGEWLLALGPDGATVRDGHAKGDAALRGPASDLDLLLWGRVPPTTVEALGDRPLIDALLAWIDRT